jgi:cellulose synthase (UDP-forming)
VFGAVFYVAEVVTYASVVLTMGLLVRMRVRTGPPSPPRGTLDIFITVCGEPVEMVEQTLVAALAIEYPHQTYLLNDSLIGRHDNSEEIVGLAERYGVPCFTRRLGARKKAANLNNALRWTDGEFVAVIDADHRAVADFAHQTLGYFTQDDLAFVCTPQRVVAGNEDPLNNQEPFFYRGLMLAKDADDAAFSCGNAVVYRRAALDSVGGFSEWNLVEDMHTSYVLHANSWKSAYHPYAITTGTAPKTAAEYTKQRLRWATDNLRLFLFDSPLRRRGLTIRQRLHYVHTSGYPIFNCFQILFMVCPVLFLVWHMPVMGFVTMASYGPRAASYMCLLGALVVIYSGSGGGLRSLRSAIAIAPIGVLATFQALTGKRVPSGVTQKDKEARFAWPAVPQYVLWLFALFGVVWAVTVRPNGATTAGLWSAWALFALCPFVAAITTDERRVRVVRKCAQLAVAGLAAMLLLPTALQMDVRHAPVGERSRPAQTTPAEPNR